MLLAIVAYLGGVLTIVSPCILPVLPFVFARADQPFLRSGLPLLAGMALTFAAVATLAAVGGGWAVHANEFGRIAAMLLLSVFGITLLVPAIADRLMRPLVALGAALSHSRPIRTRRAPGAKFSPLWCSASQPACSGHLARGRSSASSSPARRCRARMPRLHCCFSPMRRARRRHSPALS